MHFKGSMTPLERWQALLQHKKPDRIPLDYWATPEVSQKLMEHLGCSSYHALMERLHIDTLVSVSPNYVGPSLPADMDAFRIGYRWVDFGSGTYSKAVYHPMLNTAACRKSKQISPGLSRTGGITAISPSRSKVARHIRSGAGAASLL